MWAMTSFGILMPAIRPPHTVEFGDHRTLQVRARRARDLDILRAQYMQGKLGPTLHTPDKDYEYRAYCTPEAFGLAMANIITDIDYTKFKPTVTQRYSDHDLHSTYNRIWSVVMDLLSTPKHKYEYWHSGSTTSTYKPSTYKPSPVKKSAASTPATYNGVKLEKRGNTRTPSSTGYVTEQDIATYVALGAGRDTRADRDYYEPDPTLDWDNDDCATLSTGDAEIDSLYAEIDSLIDELKDKHIDHATCDHPASANARRRCRGRKRRVDEARLEELRQLIRDSYDDALDDINVALPALPAVEHTPAQSGGSPAVEDGVGK